MRSWEAAAKKASKSQMPIYLIKMGRPCLSLLCGPCGMAARTVGSSGKFQVSSRSSIYSYWRHSAKFYIISFIAASLNLRARQKRRMSVSSNLSSSISKTPLSCTQPLIRSFMASYSGDISSMYPQFFFLDIFQSCFSCTILLKTL